MRKGMLAGLFTEGCGQLRAACHSAQRGSCQPTVLRRCRQAGRANKKGHEHACGRHRLQLQAAIAGCQPAEPAPSTGRRSRGGHRNPPWASCWVGTNTTIMQSPANFSTSPPYSSSRSMTCTSQQSKLYIPYHTHIVSAKCTCCMAIELSTRRAHVCWQGMEHPGMHAT